MAHTLAELKQMQSLSLRSKIEMTQQRIKAWVDEYGEDGVYVSFSGGKDSTVLLTIARELFPNIKAAFFDTGLEFPEIRNFVREWDNVDWLKPKRIFRDVINSYGYPMISKEVSKAVFGSRRYLSGVQQGMTDIPYKVEWEKLYTDLHGYYSCNKYQYFMDAPFDIGSSCCRIMKKDLSHKYTNNTGRKPIVAMMASESRLRTQSWLENGCNAFDMVNPRSAPMAFWTEQDVLLYIKLYNIPIASVYGDIEIVSGGGWNF